MNLSQVKVGDEVQCNVRGRVFRAVVTEKSDGGVTVDPPKGITYRSLVARQIERVVVKGSQ